MKRKLMHQREFREFVVLLLMLTAGLLFRLFILDARMIHIDEGMGLRASELFAEGAWRYSPANGHGPTLFLVGALLKGTFGLNILSARAAMVVLCMITIGILAAYFRRRFVFPAQIVLLTGLVCSSGLIFYSTYFIHEMVFFLFTAIAFCSLDSWMDERRDRSLILFLLACVCMYATKETAILTWTAWIVASCVLLADHEKPHHHLRHIPWRGLVLGLFLASLLWILLFSNGLQSLESAKDAFRALLQWANRASTMHHRPFWYFGALLLIHEAPLVLGAVGVASGLFWNNLWDRKRVWLAAWFLSILFIYSIIPYKTPWCIPSILLPLVLFIASGFHVLWRKEKSAHSFIVVITAFLIGAQCVLSFGDTFIHPNREETFDYAYLQSNESLGDMTRILHDLSLLRGGSSMKMQIIGSPDELLYVLTEPYDRSFEPFKVGLPVYLNYQNDVEAMRRSLLVSSVPYVRLVFTYIQHVNSVDVFVASDLWDEYLALHPEYQEKRWGNGDYDFRR